MFLSVSEIVFSGVIAVSVEQLSQKWIFAKAHNKYFNFIHSAFPVSP